jgi:hypothetical protein
VPVSGGGQPSTGGDVPDFSYLRKQVAVDDDILIADDPEDGESVLSSSTARRPSPPTVVTPPAAPPKIIYTPPPVSVDDPLADLSGEGPKAAESHPELPLASGTPRWVWPVILALAGYSAVATAAAAWGWLRSPVPTNQVR